MKKLVTITFLLISVFVFAQKADSLLVVFPAKYNLELKGKQQNQLQEFSEYLPKNETFENYSIIATKLVIRNGKSIPLELFRDKVVEDTKKDTKNFKYTELKSTENALIFKCESDYYIKGRDKESQIYFLTKGKNDFFINIVALKQSSLPKEFVDEWYKVYNESKFVE